MTPELRILLWCVAAGAISSLWGFREVVNAFPSDSLRALRTSGAVLLILVNFVAAALIYLGASSVVNGLDTWLGALAIGLTWPTVIRNLNIKFFQPIGGGKRRDEAAVRVEQIYAALQNFAEQRIKDSLRRGNVKLMSRVVRDADLAVFAELQP